MIKQMYLALDGGSTTYDTSIMESLSRSLLVLYYLSFLDRWPVPDQSMVNCLTPQLPTIHKEEKNTSTSSTPNCQLSAMKIKVWVQLPTPNYLVFYLFMSSAKDWLIKIID